METKIYISVIVWYAYCQVAIIRNIDIYFIITKIYIIKMHRAIAVSDHVPYL